MSQGVVDTEKSILEIESLMSLRRNQGTRWDSPADSDGTQSTRERWRLTVQARRSARCDYQQNSTLP